MAKNSFGEKVPKNIEVEAVKIAKSIIVSPAILSENKWYGNEVLKNRGQNNKIKMRCW